MAAWPGWERELLEAMGIRPTAERRRFLRAWQECEGGEAEHNPLNTTFGLEGATDYNAAGVRNYADRYQGLAATLLTIRLSYYSRLRAALARRGSSAPRILRQSRRDIATWGTNPECIARVLRG